MCREMVGVRESDKGSSGWGRGLERFGGMGVLVLGW